MQIPSLKEETFGRDLSDMLQERLTFDEALAMDSRTIMTRQRLKIVKGRVVRPDGRRGGVVMADPVDELIKEIAGKHGIAVGRDDPIMILQTINARLLEDSAKAQQAMLDRYKEELEALSARWSSDAKEKAERILNVSLDASRNAMREGARETAASMRVEVDTALSRVDGALRQARVVGMLNVIASCVTLIAVATVVWAVMH